MKIIGLRSDTITLPTEEMCRAMYRTELGDDVFGENPTRGAKLRINSGLFALKDYRLVILIRCNMLISFG